MSSSHSHSHSSHSSHSHSSHSIEPFTIPLRATSTFTPSASSTTPSSSAHHTDTNDHVGTVPADTVGAMLDAYLYRHEYYQHLYNNHLFIVPLSPFGLYLHSIMRDSKTDTENFRSAADVLIQEIIMLALSTLKFKENNVSTPTGQIFSGVSLNSALTNNLHCVSILRAGESMEYPLMKLVKNIKIGKLLIQRNEVDKEKKAQLFYTKLPFLTHSHDLSEKEKEKMSKLEILLLDPMLASGSSVILAIRELVKHGITEEQITFVNVVSCPEGLNNLMKAFPKIKVVTGMIDAALNESKYILPGLGDFGDRYFGTI